MISWPARLFGIGELSYADFPSAGEVFLKLDEMQLKQILELIQKELEGKT